jgi:two-component system NtrC family response regulator
MKNKILIIDDDPSLTRQLKWFLSKHYSVEVAGSKEEGKKKFSAFKPGAVVLDLGLPPKPTATTVGLKLLAALRGIDPLAKIVVLTGHGDRESAKEAVRNGAYDYLNKPVDEEKLSLILERAVYMRELELETLKPKLEEPVTKVGDLKVIGSSPMFLKVLTEVRRVAPSDLTALITGDTGTGKEVIARLIHQLSPRMKSPFVAVNCAAIPETLLETELFGYEKGAFTGAVSSKKGKAELADKGSLFLDEVGELPIALQSKLLRFLENREVEPLGGKRPKKVDVRLIVATNRDLNDAVSKKEFRLDLYYRLHVVNLHLPPLADRGDDVIALANHFMADFCRQFGKTTISGFTDMALKALLAHPWVGNIRELQNRIAKAILLAEENFISAADLELGDVKPSKQIYAEVDTSEEVMSTLPEARKALEERMVRSALTRHEWNISKAAKDLGIGRATLYDLMKKLDIQREAEA